ncbi:MAG TPA: hypothetical protein VMT35_08900 [Ignavibacteriaceae bacterium]|nr:hypothetical protein [Ignavibacteriaceae bacterium]
MKKFLPGLVCGFGAAVFITVPGIKNYGFGCCLIIPLASILSLFLYKRTDNSVLKIEAVTAVGFGFVTGIIAAFFASFFDVLITFITRSNEFVTSLPYVESLFKSITSNPFIDYMFKIYKIMSAEITSTGFSAGYTLWVLAGNIIFFSIFGILGGLMGMLFVNKKT